MHYVRSASLAILALLIFGDVHSQTRIFPSSKQQYETYLAVNPTNPLNIVAVAITEPFLTDRKIGGYYTTDGGSTWYGNDSITAVTTRCADPLVQFDPRGVAYVVYLAKNTNDLYDIKCQRSIDGGVHWTAPQTVASPAYEGMNSEDFDRPSLAISPVADAQGHFPVYVAWTHYLAASDGGGATIQVYTSLGDGTPFGPLGYELGNPNTNQNQGSSLAVDPLGTLWIAYAELNASSWQVQRIWIKSAQMGSGTWANSHDVEASQIGATGGGKNFWIKSQQVRVESFPRIAVDNSISGNNGTVYVAWANRSSTDSSSDILVKKKPSGSNWAWGDGITGTDEQFCPAIAVGPDGTWSLLYYGILPGQDQHEVYVRHKTRNPSGEVTNDLDVGKTPKFKITPEYKPFIGDYNGVALWFGKSYGVWTEARELVGGESPQQAYFGSLNSTEVLPMGYTKTTVSQVDMLDAPYGLVGKFTSSQFIGYKAPYEFRWRNSTPYNSQVLHADPGFKAETVEKYHSWLNQSDVVNHRTFTISPGTSMLKAQAQPAYGATLLGALLENGAQGGMFGLKDPWLPNDSSDGKGYRNRGANAVWTALSSMSNNLGLSTQFKGVFLNQGDPNNLVPPYYYIRAAETQTVNGQAWVFWKWDTSGVQLTDMTAHDGQHYSTPAIFRPWGTRTVTATYKAHLASNGSDVMTAGGQRRLVAGPVSSNVDHLLVYGSAGSIWASYKAGSGAWGNEVCISGSGSNHSTPSASWGGTYLPVVWRSGSSGNYSILFNKRTSGSWLASPVSVASSLSSDPAPQIAFRTLSGSMTRRPHVAYRTSNTGLTMRWSTDDGSSWSNTSSLTENDGIGAYSLSAINTLDVYDAILTLGYISNMRTYVRDFQGSWGSRVLVPASEGENRVGDGYEPTMTDNLALQVVRDMGSDRTDVAFNQYQEYYNEQTQDWLTKYYQVVHTRDDQGTWGTATAYETSSFGTPTLSFVNGMFTMLWEDGGTLYKAQESQGTWGEPSSTGSGAEPALAVSSGTSTSSAHYAWRENASGLYKIVPSSSQMSRTVGPQQPAKRTSEGWVYRRVITMIDTVTGGVFSVTASLPSVAGRLAPLISVNDTLPGINAMNFFSFMEPAPFTAESGDTLAYELTFASRRWPKDAGMVALQAGIEAARLTQSMAERSIDLTRKSLPLRLKVPLEPSSGSPVRLALAGSLPEWADRCVFTLTHVYAKPITSEPVVEATPTQTVEPSQEEALAVYPNPFNPETKVGYMMKEGGWVKVSVFDLLGREVAVLVDGWKPAGTHSAIWNARALPSGTYICRLTTQEAGWSVVKTVKMQYLR